MLATRCVGRVSERTDEVLRKYFDGNYSGHITLSKDGFGFRTDCALHLDSGITLEADSNAVDAYSSADQALAQIEKRLRRYKSRLKDRTLKLQSDQLFGIHLLKVMKKVVNLARDIVSCSFDSMQSFYNFTSATRTFCQIVIRIPHCFDGCVVRSVTVLSFTGETFGEFAKSETSRCTNTSSNWDTS
jgi:ribosomal subunit interface protein